MKGNNSQRQDGQYMVPMEITVEAARDFGIDPKDLVWFWLGVRKCRVYLVPASREVYYAYMRPVWAEVRRMLREGREQRPMSLPALLDEGAEPAADGFEDDVIHSILFRELLAMLTEIKPEFGGIFPMLCDGASQQEISDRLGIEQRTVSDDIRKIRGILQPLMEDLFDR